MDVSIDLFSMIKLAAKLAQHKVQQYRLTTTETEVRETNDGKIKGVKRKTIYDDYYYAFEGIPYAKPPVGELRFRAPQRVEPWEGILDCTDCKNKPLQKHIVLPFVEGSEDCLYLNVYVKSLKTDGPLPVLVWIHGGGFLIGEASRDLYAPDYFMMHDIVLVSITYRLGALGFLSLNDPDLDVPGNAGIKDQIMALRWVKSNIQHLNGDPNNITLFGESAGGASTHILLSCPQTKNLFHKAIMMSGSAYSPWCFIPQRDWAFRLACQLGYNGPNNDKQIFRFLMKMDGKRIVTASCRIQSKQDTREHIISSFVPTVEPYDSENSVATKSFLEMFKNAWSHEIPVIMGFTSFEGLFFYQYPKKNPYVINELGDCEAMIPFDARVGKKDEEIRDIGLTIKNLYFNNETPTLEKHFNQYLDLTSYGMLFHGVYRALLARLSYAQNSPTYFYRFDVDSPFFNHYRILKCGTKQRGVSHADDLSYLFYNLTASKLPPESLELKTIQRLTSMWVSFAKTSDPNCDEISPTKWEALHGTEKDDVKCLNIGDKIEFINLPEYEKINIWNKFYTKDTLF